MKTRIVSVAVGCLLACFASTVSAGLINIDIDGRGGAPAPTLYSGAAAIGAAGDVWNSYVVDSNVIARPGDPSASGLLQYSDGTASTATFDITSPVAADAPNYSGNALIDDCAYVKGTIPDSIPDNATWTISGLAAGGQYNVYVYCGISSTNYGGTFTVGSVSRTQTVGVFDGTLTADRDYLAFTNVTAAGDGSISGSWTGVGVGYYALLCGLQIESVPEPSTFALGIAGALGLMAYAWRKRK